METGSLCHFCGRDIASASEMGTNADGSPQPAYCAGCYKRGNMVPPRWVPLWLAKLVDMSGLRKEGVSDADVRRIVARLPSLAWWRAKKMK